jgi:hypothetical protein
VPQFGRLDVAARADRLPRVRVLATEAFETDTRVLNFSYELDDAHHLDLFPPALHPSIPLWGNLMLREHATSPVGPFTLAELRVITRAGIHPGGFVFGAFASTPEAVAFLRESYGAPVRVGEVRIDRRHDAIVGIVRADGRSVLEAALERAEPISPADVLYHVSFHLAAVDGVLRIVQVEPRYTPAAAERGTPRVRVFDAEAFGEPRAKLANPLPATFMTGKVELRRVRWLVDPLRPAVVGSTRVGGRE